MLNFGPGRSLLFYKLYLVSSFGSLRIAKSLYQKSKIYRRNSNIVPLALFDGVFCHPQYLDFWSRTNKNIKKNSLYFEQVHGYDNNCLSHAVSSCCVLFNPNIGLGLSDLQAHTTRIPMGHSRSWKYRERSLF